MNVEVSRNIAVVTIARPPVNAFTPELFDKLRRIFHGLADDLSVRAAILTGEGRTFCAGSDINGFIEQTFEQSNDELALIRVAFNALYDCPVPVIAAVNGAALGAGIVLSSLCDIRIASERASFALPEIAVGAMGGARHVMRMTTQGMTRLMSFTGCRISAEEALRALMVERVVSHDELMPAAMEIAEQIAAKSPNAIRMAKQAVNRAEVMSLKEGYEYECSLISSLRKTDEAREAALAFIEKRLPHFARDR
jgi:enoyl-CoA hydratase